MRLKLKLKAKESPAVIPVNYQYYFSAAVYLLLKFGSPEFSKFLHDQGFNLNGKKFKLFVFGLRLNKPVMRDGLFFLNDSQCELIISSPLIETFIRHFVLGTFEKQNIFINYQERSTKFLIHEVEMIPSPQFTSEMKFEMLSPLTVSTMIKKNERVIPYYYRYDDSNLTQAIKNNLLKKYKLLYNSDLTPAHFDFEFNKDEIERKMGNISKLITVAEGTPQQSKVKAIQCGFRIKTNPELVKVGYDCGFGEKNSMGFGLVKVHK
ncbi:MAG: CRISPR-associated endoribonuclease Cas6 [Bacteroidetes bacterium]|nr:CRISPR-associated endoribonuclease Cas6 [Bacteroidota bacterium]MBU2584311.1 CRISPR-associated endoribonuclease Cas6 [Bacteroidota bacterium]